MDVKAKKLRREGYVTGNVFGREMKESVPVKMEKAAVDRLLKACHKGQTASFALVADDDWTFGIALHHQ